MKNEYDVDSYTGGAVIAIKCAGGVVVGVDTAMESNFAYEPRTFCRYIRLSKSCLVAASGRHCDLQKLVGKVKEKKFAHDKLSEFEELQPEELYQLVSQVLYERRNHFEPLLVNVTVAGATNEKSFLGRIDMYGSGVVEDFVCSGRASYFALPIIRRQFRPNMSIDDAKMLIARCLQINTSVDPFSSCSVQFAVIADGKCVIQSPFTVERSQ